MITVSRRARLFDLRPGKKEALSLWIRPGKNAGSSNNVPRNRAVSILSFVRPGSDLASWHLTPGGNQVFVYTDDTSVVARLRWRKRYWSADGVA